MPSPFPGMDPYLEGSLWISVHTQLCAEIARQLAPQLRPKYLALTSERFVTESLEPVAVTTSLYPDVAVSRTSRVADGGGTAVLEPPVRAMAVLPERVPHVTVEIRDTAGRQLVTAIEVLSPTNKRGEGYAEYLARRARLLYGGVHLVEIDLLRRGERVPTEGPLPAASYFVFVSRAEARPEMEVWPVSLAASLPTVPVPLLPEDGSVALDLQLAFGNVYDLLGYDLAVNYAASPEVPFNGAEREAALAAQLPTG